MNVLLYDFLRVVSVFVGFKNSRLLNDVLCKIMELMGNAYGLKKDEIRDLQDIVFKLFSIETYEDYKMISKVNTSDVFSDSNIYYEILQHKNNISSNFCSMEFKENLNEYTLEGDISSIRLKGILLYLGSVYPKNIKGAVEHLKITAYVGDLISFKLLSFIDKENKNQYDDAYSCLNDVYNNGLLSINKSHYSKETKELCEWILENKCEVKKNKNENLLRYVFLSKNPIVKKIVDVICGNTTLKNKIGF